MGESGSRQASALSSGLRKGVVAGATAAGAAGAAAFGTALKLGFDRLTAIDNAKGKLRGLGHDAAAQAKIMDSAMASVKGTAFGLGDAASISASAIAAGIKPGQELTKYLKTTADAATIAGSSLGEMGSIFNQVQTGQQAMTDDLNQLADRGIPIYQWLAKEMKVSAGEVKGLASEGKVSSEIFFRAVQSNIAGAALESGKTVTGSFNNVKAALGRLGAAALEPSFNRLPATFGSITSSLDGATPRIKEFAKGLDAKVFDEWIPAAQKAFNNPEVRAGLTEASQLGASFLQVVRDLAPAAGQIAGSLAQASGALGVSTWQLFITGLEAAVGVLSTLEPLISGVAGLMRDNQAVVTTAVAAWLLFKTVPGLLNNVTRAISPVSGAAQTMGTRFTGAIGNVRDFGEAYRQSMTWVRQSNPTISTASAHMQVLRANASTAASAGMNALKSGASGVIGALGGPFSAALVGAGIAFAAISAKNQKATQSMEAYDQATKNVSKTQIALNEALMSSRGSGTDTNVKDAGLERMQAYREQLEAESNRTGSFWDRYKIGNQTREAGQSPTSRATDIERQAEAAKSAVAELDKLKMTQQNLADVTYGGQAAFDALIGKLNASGDAGRRVAADMQQARTEFQQQQDMARRAAPGINELSKAMQVLSDKTASASDKSNALKAALDALNPARTAGDAIAAHDKVLQQVADSSQQAADRTKGFGDQLIGIGGAISTTTANGNALRDSLKSIVDASTEAVSKGQPVAEVNAKNAAAFQQLATQYGVTVEQIQAAYGTLGGKDLTFVAKVTGAPEAVQQVGLVARAFEAMPDKKEIPFQTNQIQAARGELEKLGFKVEEIKDRPGWVNVSANTDAAKARLAEIKTIISSEIPSDKPINLSAPGGQAVYDLLKSMGAQIDKNEDGTIRVDAPLAPAVLEQLKSLGIQIDRNKDGTINVKQIGAEAAGGQIDQAAKDRTSTITIRQVIESGRYNIGDSLPGGGTLRGPGIASNAQGAIVAMAGGGLRQIAKPQTAGIYAGRGAGTIFAEEETGGEAYIPLAGSKRGRSTAILAEVARLFGMTLVGPTQSFAEGGLRTAAAINDFPRASGLEGSPYVWGGVNWGDCSGAMSAIANFAVGLAPFASRFATASEGAELAKRGFKTGRGPAGSLRFGWVNGGPGGGHTAGTLPDGTNVEMGGARGNGQVGGKAAGADDPQFTDHAYLPLGDSGQTTGSPSQAMVDAATQQVNAAQTSLEQARQRQQALGPDAKPEDVQNAAALVAAGESTLTAAQAKLDQLQSKAAGSDSTSTSAAPSGEQRVYVTNWPVGLGDTQSSSAGVKFSLFANGGIEDHTAHITDKLRVFGEPETGGEAYIPLAPSKRARSLAIWQQTGKRLGVNAFAAGGIAAPKIEAPKIDVKAPALGPGMALPIPDGAGAPQLADSQAPAATFDGAKYTQERLTKLGVDMLGIAKDAAIQTLVPGGALPSVLTNSVGLAKSIGEGLQSSQQNQRGESSTTTNQNGGDTTVNIYATNTDDAFRQWQTKQTATRWPSRASSHDRPRPHLQVGSVRRRRLLLVHPVPGPARGRRRGCPARRRPQGARRRPREDDLQRHRLPGGRDLRRQAGHDAQPRAHGEVLRPRRRGRGHRIPLAHGVGLRHRHHHPHHHRRRPAVRAVDQGAPRQGARRHHADGQGHAAHRPVQRRAHARRGRSVLLRARRARPLDRDHEQRRQRHRHHLQPDGSEAVAAVGAHRAGHLAHPRLQLRRQLQGVGGRARQPRHRPPEPRHRAARQPRHVPGQRARRRRR